MDWLIMYASDLPIMSNSVTLVGLIGLSYWVGSSWVNCCRGMGEWKCVLINLCEVWSPIRSYVWKRIDRLLRVVKIWTLLKAHVHSSLVSCDSLLNGLKTLKRRAVSAVQRRCVRAGWIMTSAERVTHTHTHTSSSNLRRNTQSLRSVSLVT